MPTYIYSCSDHGTFELVMKMSEVGGPRPCPHCGAPSRQVFIPIPDVWHTDGAYKTDRKGVPGPGDKQDYLNKIWSDAGFGDPPEPAKDVPRNSGEKY